MAKTAKKSGKLGSSKPSQTHDSLTLCDKSSKSSSGKKKCRGARVSDASKDDDKFRRKLQAGEFVLVEGYIIGIFFHEFSTPGCFSFAGEDGLAIADMAADGNCLFRSLSDQLYGDYGNMHEEVRSEICDYMEQNKDDFQVFLVLDDDSCVEGDDGKDFESYIETMRGEAEWGGNLELVAAARLYERKVTVFSAALSAYTIEPDVKPSGPDILLSFHDNDHYNSVRDEKAPPRPILKRIKEKSKTTEPRVLAKQVLERTATSSTTASTISEALSVSESKGTAKAPVDRKAVCPCGSGQRYKKCCLAKEKHATRLGKMKRIEPKQENKRDAAAESESPKMIGSFVVLKI
jgi:OTU domain-containing protein 3